MMHQTTIAAMLGVLLVVALGVGIYFLGNEDDSNRRHQVYISDTEI